MKPRSVRIGYAIILLWTMWPMLPPLVASVIAALCGCTLNEGDVHPCLVFGWDVGGALYGMMVMGWLGIATLPTGLLALAIFTAIVFVSRARARRHARATDGA